MGQPNKNPKVVTPPIATTQTQTPKVEAPKVETPKEVLTIASVFQKLGIEEHKDRDALADGIISYLKGKGVTNNVRGHEIRKERVLQQISAMLRDIKEKRGEKTKSWWSTYTIEETDKSFKIIKVPQQQ